MIGATAKILPCPFCGQPGCVETTECKGKDYFTIGCRTRGCFGSIGRQSVALPLEQAADLLASWNTRFIGDRFAMALTWTKTPPTSTGWHWFRADDSSPHAMQRGKPVVVWVGIWHGKTCCHFPQGSFFTASMGGEWAGPIEEPKDAAP